MNKKYLLIGAIGLIAVYFIYKKFVAKNDSPLDVTKLGKKEKKEEPLNPLALKQRPNLPSNPYGVIDSATKPEFNPMESALSLEKKYNAYC